MTDGCAYILPPATLPIPVAWWSAGGGGFGRTAEIVRPTPGQRMMMAARARKRLRKARVRECIAARKRRKADSHSPWARGFAVYMDDVEPVDNLALWPWRTLDD